MPYKDKEKQKEYNEQYYKENREKENERFKKYYWENKKRENERFKKYRWKYKEKENKRIMQWQKENPEIFKKSLRKYRKTEEGKATKQRTNIARRTLMKNIINTLTSKEWLDILEEYNYRCAYCGIEFDCENLPTKDHILPISKGGNNVKENIVPACKSCNSKKKDKIENPTLSNIAQCLIN